MKREDLEAAGRSAGEELALSNVGLDLAHNWGKWNAARKGKGKSQMAAGIQSDTPSTAKSPLSGKKTVVPAASTTAHRHDPMDEAMAEFGADDDQAAARARMAGGDRGRRRVIPDAPGLSTPRPINGQLVSEMDRNVVTVPSYREGALTSSAAIKKYIESGRDITVHDVGGSGTASITDFKPGSTMVFRYDRMRKVATLKVPSMTKPWDGTDEGPKPRAGSSVAGVRRRAVARRAARTPDPAAAARRAADIAEVVDPQTGQIRIGGKGTGTYIGS